MTFSEADYQAVLREFAALSDPKYKAFNEKLIPGTETAYGVRTPEIRRMAKAIAKNSPEDFLAVSRPDSFEETLLRGIVIATMKAEMNRRIALTQEFLPLIDNWAVCDLFCSSFSLKKPAEQQEMWLFLQPLFQDSREFYARFAAVMLLDHYISEQWILQDLALLENMKQPFYYTQMAVAWAVSVCYVKFPKETLALLKRRTLSPFVQNKSIQKIRESFRVSREEKDTLLAFKLPTVS